MKIRSVKFNFIMNFILTASSVVFPLITYPYISRVLQAAGNGKVAFAASVITYFSMFACLGIPTYGIRACAKVRNDKEQLSTTVQELLIINTVMLVVTYGAFLLLMACVPQFAAEKELLFINSITMVLNVFGISWLYSALEQYAYITVCSLVFKVISIVMMFAWVKQPEDYVIYGAITVFASGGSYVLNFINLHRHVSLRKTRKYHFRKHFKPIGTFFAMTAATSVYTNLDIVMLRFMKDDAEVGYYNAAIKVKTILVSMITSLGTVLLPRLSFYMHTENKKAFRDTIIKAFNFVLITAAAVTVFFMIFAEESILVLAGEDFREAVWPMILLMPTVLLIGLSNITGIQVLTPTNREREVLISIVCGAVLDFVLNFILIPQYGAAGAAFATLMAELVVLIIQFVFLRDMLKVVARAISFRKTIIALTAVTVIAIVLKIYLSVQPFLLMCIAAVAFFGGYGILLLVQKEAFMLEMWDMVKRIMRRR